MKFAIRLVTATLAIAIVFYAVMMVASESGEVVVVTTTDAAGQTQQTRLWTVSYDGSAWLRSGSPASGWYARVLANPVVTFRRGDETREATAVPTPAATPAINALMNEKYGWADDTIDFLFGREDAIAIRLVTEPPPAP